MIGTYTKHLTREEGSGLLSRNSGNWKNLKSSNFHAKNRLISASSEYG